MLISPCRVARRIISQEPPTATGFFGTRTGWEACVLRLASQSAIYQVHSVAPAGALAQRGTQPGFFPVQSGEFLRQRHSADSNLFSIPWDLAVNIRGAAGTGKTATLHELQRGLEQSGHEMLAVAPTMSAVEEL
jgi:hypothetical protein